MAAVPDNTDTKNRCRETCAVICDRQALIDQLEAQNEKLRAEIIELDLLVENERTDEQLIDENMILKGAMMSIKGDVARLQAENKNLRTENDKWRALSVTIGSAGEHVTIAKLPTRAFLSLPRRLSPYRHLPSPLPACPPRLLPSHPGPPMCTRPPPPAAPASPPAFVHAPPMS